MLLKTGSSRDIAIAVIIAGLWVSVMLMAYWNYSPPDMAALYFAGYFFDIGRYDLVYAAPEFLFGNEMHAAWFGAFDEIGYKGKIAYPFVYPPIWAALFSVFPPNLDASLFFRLTYIIQIPLIPISIFLAWRTIGRVIPLTFIMLIALNFMWATVFSAVTIPNSQPAIFITFLLILWLDQWKRGNHKAAIVALALASAIKIYPAAFILIYLVNKQYRLLAWYTLLMLFIVAVSFALAGDDLHWIFLEQIRRISKLAMVISPVFSIESLLTQLHYAGSLDAINGLTLNPPRYQIDEPGWISVATPMTFIIAVAFLVNRFSAASPEWRTTAFPIALLVLVPLCGPLGWAYHYLPVLFLAPAAAIFWGKWAAYILPLVVFFSLNLSFQSYLATLTDKINFWQASGTLAMIFLFLVFALAPDPKPST